VPCLRQEVCHFKKLQVDNLLYKFFGITTPNLPQQLTGTVAGITAGLQLGVDVAAYEGKKSQNESYNQRVVRCKEKMMDARVGLVINQLAGLIAVDIELLKLY
jgi:thiamine monophosphate synthase